VRFTAGDGRVNAILLDVSEPELTLRGVDASGVSGVRLLGLDEAVDFSIDDGALTVRLPERMPVSPAHVLALQGELWPG